MSSRSSRSSGSLRSRRSRAARQLHVARPSDRHHHSPFTLMGQGSRPDRVADLIRAEVTTMIARELHDPGVGFVTVTRVQVSRRPPARPCVLHEPRRCRRPQEHGARARAGRRLHAPPDWPAAAAAPRPPKSTSSSTTSIGHQDRVEQLLKEIADEHTPSRPGRRRPQEPDDR